LTAKSATASIIDATARSVFSGALKPEGFIRTGRSFFRKRGDFFEVINFQSSWLNTPQEADFFVNLNITLPFFHEIWTGGKFPKNPGSAANLVQVRLNMVLPDSAKGIYYRLTPETAPEPITEEISQFLIQYGLPYLDDRACVEWMLKAVEGKTKGSQTAPLGIPYPPIVVNAILQAYQGRMSEAEEGLVLAKQTEKKPWQGYDMILLRLQNAQQSAGPA